MKWSSVTLGLEVSPDNRHVDSDTAIKICPIHTGKHLKGSMCFCIAYQQREHVSHADGVCYLAFSGQLSGSLCNFPNVVLKVRTGGTSVAHIFSQSLLI